MAELDYDRIAREHINVIFDNTWDTFLTFGLKLPTPLFNRAFYNEPDEFKLFVKLRELKYSPLVRENEAMKKVIDEAIYNTLMLMLPPLYEPS